MYRLTVRFSGKLVGTHDFDKEQVTIGRAPDCDIVIDNLGVSRVHAQIERSGDFYVLRDLKSNNGTFVRGEKIQRYNLNNGDEFFLGKHSLTFACEEGEEYGWLEEDEHTQMSPQKEDARDMQAVTMSMNEKDIKALQERQLSSLAAYFSVIGASGIRQQLPITKNAIFFGSHPKCDYSIEGWFTSKRHAMVLREESGFRLIHLANKKPPKINGTEVDDQKLKHGDIIEVGELQLTFNIGSPSGL